MFKQTFNILIVFFLLTSEFKVDCKKKYKLKDGKCDNKYRSPGTVKFPIGDEELNNNIFEPPGVNEAQEKHECLHDVKLKCKSPHQNEYQNPHVNCACNNPAEVLFTSEEAEQIPSLQCRKCDLKVTSDGKAVIVRCFDCLDYTSKSSDVRDVVYMVYYLEIANYTLTS